MADTAKTPNYTEEMVERMLARYEELGNDGLETIAEELGRSVRSVRSKLVREGAYVTPTVKPRAAVKDGPTKKDLLNELEQIAPFEVDGLMGATKAAIAAIITYVQAHAEVEAEELD